jgi:hypothetical protein
MWKKEYNLVTLSKDTFNEIELSIVDLYEYSSSMIKEEIIETIIKVCSMRNLISLDNMILLFPNLTFIHSLKDKQDLYSNSILKSIQDMQHVINSSELNESNYSQLEITLPIISSICNSLQSEWIAQQEIIRFILLLLDPSKKLSNDLISFIFSFFTPTHTSSLPDPSSAQQVSNTMIDIITLYGSLKPFIRSLCFHLDQWGSSQGFYLFIYLFLIL